MAAIRAALAMHDLRDALVVSIALYVLGLWPGQWRFNHKLLEPTDAAVSQLSEPRSAPVKLLPPLDWDDEAGERWRSLLPPLLKRTLQARLVRRHARSAAT